MVSEPAIARFVGAAAFARADAYQRQRRVSGVDWSADRSTLSGLVRGSEPRPYSPRVRLERDEPVSGRCDCPVGDRCKHVGALLLEAARVPATAAPARSAAWRRQLDPILEGLDPRETGAGLGIWFELQPSGRYRPDPGRFARSAPRPPAYTVAVRPVARAASGKWRRTGVSWRDVALDVTLSDYEDRQVDVLRRLHRLLADSGAQAAGSSWLPLDHVRGPGLWEVLQDAEREGVGLVCGGRMQAQLTLGAAVRASLDVRRRDGGLELAPVVIDAAGAALPGPVALLGEPAIGVATWTAQRDAPLSDAVLTLHPFDGPLLPGAHSVLALPEPVSVPRDEEGAFLADHYRRLAAILPVVSGDGSFTPPAAPVVTLGLTLEHAGGVLAGRWWWRADSPGSPPGSRSPFGRGEPRDPVQERALTAAVADAGVGVLRTPALVDPVSGRIRERFELRGMAVVGFARDVLPELGRIPHLEVESAGDPLDFRESDEAPVVRVATRERQGERDWFDLDIEVTLGDERVPISAVLTALAHGDDFAVLPGGVWFPLTGEVFDRLRQLVEEARELADRPLDTLRISRFQGSLWDDLAALGVVAEQSEAWRRAVEAVEPGAERPPQELPAGFAVELRPYQRAGYDWLCGLYDAGLGGVLADDMGLGKTVQSLALIARVVQRARAAGERARFLVVAPTSVVPNWVAEAGRCTPDLAVAGVGETVRRAGRPLAESVGDADVVVTSYALLRIDALDYAHLGFAGLLLDEAQFVKNRESVVHQRARVFPAPFKLALTGTPMENSLMDLWSVLSIVAPGLFPSPRGFAEFYQRPIEKEGDALRLAQLRRRMRPLMLRRTKSLVATELPEKLEQVIELDLDPAQRAVYDRYLNRERQRVLGLLGEFDRNRFQVFRALTLLRQVALDAALVDDAHEEVPSAKLDLLDELLADAIAEGHRVLVFSQFTRLLARVRRRLDAAGIGYASLEGSTRRRDEVIDRFRSGQVPVFLISLKAGGFGLNLAEADYCVLLDPWWNPAAEAQAVDRAHRIGQTRPVHVYRLVARDTIEEKVMALKASKAALFDAVIGDGAGAGSTVLTAEDVRALLG